MATRTEARERRRRDESLRTRRRQERPVRKPPKWEFTFQLPELPSLEGSPHPERPGRQVGPAGRVLVIGVICLFFWTLLAAPALRRAAESSPLGARRTAALAVLRPIARISEFLSLDRVGASAESLLGRDTNVEPAFPPADPRPSPFPEPRGRRARPTSPSPSPEPREPEPASLVHEPTTRDPLRLLVVGDSLAADLGIGLSRILDDERWEMKIDYEVSSGLARPDFFDWGRRLQTDISRFRPDIVAVMLGGNDDQNFISGGRGLVLGSPEWRAVYRRRVAQIMELGTRDGRAVVWVGMPVMKDAVQAQGMRLVNGIYASEAPRHPGVLFVDSWRLFTSWKGQYAVALRTPSGRLAHMRTPDGVHFTPTGSERLAAEVLRAMRSLWAPPEKAPSPAPTTGPYPRGTDPTSGPGAASRSGDRRPRPARLYPMRAA